MRRRQEQEVRGKAREQRLLSYKLLQDYNLSCPISDLRDAYVDFEGASSLTITCEESEEQSNPPSSTNRTSSSKKAVSDQQLSLFGTSSATVTVSVVASPVFDLSATMQSLRTLYTFDIIALIEESKKRIRDAQ